MNHERLVSLDAFRGLTIAGMIVVNSPGISRHVYPPLRHAAWHGITPTDLVFPFFLFIMGVAIALGYGRRLATGATLAELWPKILKRTIVLIALGILLNMTRNIEDLRFVGVLQRIGIVFFFCAVLFLSTGWKTQLWTMAGLLIAYWLTMTGVPGHALTPDDNLSAWIDGYLVPGRMHRGTWDPEGLFGTLPAIATGLSGVLVGHILVSAATIERRIAWIFSLGTLAFALGAVWGWVFPLNKNLWTSSYVLYTSGLAAIAFGTSIFLIDVVGIRKGTKPWIVFGANAIAVYVLHELLRWPLSLLPVTGGEHARSVRDLFADAFTSMGIAPELVSLLWALAYTGLCFIPIALLYRKRVFIKV